MWGPRTLQLHGRQATSTSRLTLAYFCLSRIVQLELLFDPNRISIVKPKSLASMLVPEIWLIRFFLAYSVIPPFIRIAEEHLPQVEAVSGFYQTTFTYNSITEMKNEPSKKSKKTIRWRIVKNAQEALQGKEYKRKKNKRRKIHQTWEKEKKKQLHIFISNHNKMAQFQTTTVCNCRGKQRKKRVACYNSYGRCCKILKKLSSLIIGIEQSLSSCGLPPNTRIKRKRKKEYISIYIYIPPDSEFSIFL